MRKILRPRRILRIVSKIIKQKSKEKRKKMKLARICLIFFRSNIYLLY